MSPPERLTFALPSELAGTLRAAVDIGDYASEGEIVREALHEWSRARANDAAKLEWLREAVRVGDESGPGIPAAEVYAELDRIIAEYAAVPR